MDGMGAVSGESAAEAIRTSGIRGKRGDIRMVFAFSLLILSFASFAARKISRGRYTLTDETYKEPWDADVWVYDVQHGQPDMQSL
jgi:hypothetical protein